MPMCGHLAPARGSIRGVKVYLSAYLFGEAIDALRPVTGHGNAGVVFNALDHFGSTRLRNVTREFGPLESFGYSCRELDLREYFGAPDSLVNRLHDVDLLWVVGGNAFVLARAIARSGLRSALSRTAEYKPFTYGGYSAGACVAGPDLTALDLIDDPAELPDGYSADMPAECLRLVPYRVVPHWRSVHAESERAELVAERLGEMGLPFRCLRDGEALIAEAVP